MRKLFLPLLLIIFLLTGCGTEQDSEKNKIVIGLDDEFAPFGFRDDKGELVGLDIDLANEAAERMGVEVEFKPIDWNKKEGELNSGNIDMIWNGLDMTPEREKIFLYSKPYMDSRQILLVKIDSDLDFHSEQDLAGKIVGTQIGSSAGNYIESNSKLRDSFADLKTYATFKQAFADLMNEKIDALIVDELVGRYEMSKVPEKFKAIEVTVGHVAKVGIGFRKNDTELRDRVQKVFNEMVKDGTTKKISEKWFGADLIK